MGGAGGARGPAGEEHRKGSDDMTGKGLQNIVNELVDVVVMAKGLKPEIEAKGGERNLAVSLVGMALKDATGEIFKHIPGMTPEVVAKAREQIGTAAPKLKVARPPADTAPPTATNADTGTATNATNATDAANAAETGTAAETEAGTQAGDTGLMPGESHNDAEKRLHTALDKEGHPVGNTTKKKPALANA